MPEATHADARLQVKELEHRKVKRLAGEILGQRGDVEAFFLQVPPSPCMRHLPLVRRLTRARRR